MKHLMLPNIADFASPPPLAHFKRLTTKDGIIQHADLEVPDPSFGYSIDDNARALIACLWHFRLHNDPAVLRLADIYFTYLKKVEIEGGSFHNFLSFMEKILDAEGSEDSIGRAIWALGETVALHPEEEHREQALAMINRANLNRHLEHAHLRSKAYIALGLAAANKVEMMTGWIDQLVVAYEAAAGKDWRWFENSLRYANGILPYALAVAYTKTKDEQYLVIARESLDWLDAVSRIDGVVAPIGQAGWWFRGEEKAEYDQQPLEAADMVLAAGMLYEITKEEKYQTLALEWMNWYNGQNSQEKSLVSEATKGVYDALTPGGVNKNQGAESIVTYLLAYLFLARLNHR